MLLCLLVEIKLQAIAKLWQGNAKHFCFIQRYFTKVMEIRTRISNNE